MLLTCITSHVQVDLDDIKIVKKLGGTIEDTELVDGIVFDCSASHAAGGPSRVQNVKVGLIQYCLSAPKTNVSWRCVFMYDEVTLCKM